MTTVECLNCEKVYFIIQSSMLKQLQIGLRAFLLLASRVWTCLCYMIKKQSRAIIQHQSVKYDIFPLSPLSRHRLSIVKRKVLVLDLDETLIHSFHDGVVRQTVRPGTPPDFVLKVVIDHHPVRFFVHKRPHVDFFLDIVSQWYELVVFTASMEIYGAAVADRLDAGRGILIRRFYRQHCTPDMGSYTKDLSAICNDLSSVFILDNSPGAYRAYPDNAIPIKSWFSDPTDVALLNLLPVLDALRFTADVRSVLSRNLHLHRLCQTSSKVPEIATVLADVMNESGECGNNINVASNNSTNNSNGQCGGGTSSATMIQQHQQHRCSDSVLIPLCRTKRTEQSNDLNCNQDLMKDEVMLAGERPKKT